MNIFQKMFGRKQVTAVNPEPEPVKVVSIEEISRGYEYNANEMQAIQKVANASTIYQVIINVLFEVGLNPEGVKRLRDESDVLFPHPQRRALAMNFLNEMEKMFAQLDMQFQKDLDEIAVAAKADGRSQEEIDSLKGRLSKKPGFLFLLRDDARMDYLASVQIIKTLIPDDIWQEVALPQIAKYNIQDDIPRLF